MRSEAETVVIVLLDRQPWQAVEITPAMRALHLAHAPGVALSPVCRTCSCCTVASFCATEEYAGPIAMKPFAVPIATVIGNLIHARTFSRMTSDQQARP